MTSSEPSSKHGSHPNGTTKTRVIIADAHACVRDLVEVALRLEGGCQVVAHTGLGADANV